MAILNVTPDSFFAGSRMPDATHVERRVKEAAAEGASIIDVGGYSSRPGADEVPADEEWRRVEPGHRGRAASGARRPDFGRYLPQRSRRPCDRKIRSAHHQRHLRRGTRPADARHGCALRRALRRHAHEGRSPDHADPHRLQTRHHGRGHGLFRNEDRRPARRRDQTREHYPRPRLRLRQDHRTELRACLRACTVSAHWGIPYWRAFRASR